MSRLRSSVKRLLPTSGRRWLKSWWKAHSHAVVSGNGGGAFCSIGNPESIEHFTRIYLGGPADARISSGINRADFSALAIRMAQSHGLVVISGVPLPHRLKSIALRVPRFVAMTVDIGATEEAFLKTFSTDSVPSDLRRIRRSGLYCEHHRDASWANEFVDNYHMVSITGRHGSEGFVATARDIARAVKDDGWEFLLVKQGERCLAAMIGEPHPAGYQMGRLGWLHGDPALVKQGVLSALYWFSIQRARELGLRRVRMAGTPPYLEDGVFQYKMKWNAELDREDTRYGMRHLVLDPDHPAVRSLLERWSIIALDSEDRFVVYSARGPDQVRVSDRVQRGLEAWYRYPTVRP